MTRTKYMTHFIAASEGFVALEKTAGGLAGEMFLGLKELAVEKGLDNLLSEFEKAMIDAETHVKKDLPDGVTLSQHSTRWKVNKSELKRAIKAGSDPSKFESFRKFVDSAKNKTDTSTPNAKAGGGYTPHDDKGGVSGGTISSAKVAIATSNMPSKVAEATGRLSKLLSTMTEEDALTVLKGAEGKCHSLLKKRGGRMANVKAA